jgi:hypothetical protein
MIRHHKLGKQFCRSACRNAYLQLRLRDIAARKRAWAAALSLSVFDRMFGSKNAVSDPQLSERTDS